MDAIQHLDNRSDRDVEPGFLQHLARDSLLQTLAEFHSAPRQTPFPLKRWMSTLHQHDPIAVDNDRTHTHDRPFRKGPHLSDAHGLDDHPLPALSVEFRVEHLLPRTEIQ